MTRLLRGFLALLTSLLMCLALVSPAGSGSMGLLGVGGPSAAAPTYTGPGDVITGSNGYWSLRGYSAAYSTGSNPAAIICDVGTGATCITINILSNGKFDTSTASTFCTLHTSCVVKQLYDQSGSGFHLTQATLANMPALTFSAIGSLPGLTFSGNQNMCNASPALTPPLTAIMAAKRTANFTSFQVVITTSGNPILDFFTSADTIEWDAAAFVTHPSVSGATDGVFHAAQAVSDGSNNTLYVDSLSPSGPLGGAGGANTGICIGDRQLGSGGGVALTGVYLESGTWPSAFTSGNASSMNSNQHGYWGF